jgi:FtsP/CotA-like multicopper oxidase with cupredoxin domain
MHCWWDGGARYDVLIQLHDSIFPLVAMAEGKSAQALVVVQTGRGRCRLGPVTPHRTHRLVLDGNMATYRWTINERTMHGGAPLKVRDGERVRLVSHAADCGWH